MSALTTRDALRKVGADHAFIVDDAAYGREGCNCGWLRRAFDDATHEDHLMSALLASGAVVDAATLADDDALLTDICHRQGLSEGDGWIWEERGIAVACTFRDLAAVLSERSPR